MKTLHNTYFPHPVDILIQTLGETGFFDRSLLIGSWVLPIYQELYGIRYVLKTGDIDFAVHLAHPRKGLKADLDSMIMALGFVDIIRDDGVKKFTAETYEVEFIVHRSGGRGNSAIDVPEWNLNAIPLPFINLMLDFSETATWNKHKIRFPVPESFFFHKLIIAQRRLSLQKRQKDLDQCLVIAPVLREELLQEIAQSRKFSKATKTQIFQSCRDIEFPLQKLNLTLPVP